MTESHAEDKWESKGAKEWKGRAAAGMGMGVSDWERGSRSPREVQTVPNHPTTLRRGPPLLGKEGSAGLQKWS